MIILRLDVTLTGFKEMSAKHRWDFTKDIHNMLASLIGSKTEDLLPLDDSELLKEYYDSSEAVTYVVQRLRNIPNSFIHSVTRSYPTTITISIANLGKGQDRLLDKSK